MKQWELGKLPGKYHKNEEDSLISMNMHHLELTPEAYKNNMKKIFFRIGLWQDF